MSDKATTDQRQLPDKTALSWIELNERQQIYLKTIYEIDQKNEKYEKSAWISGYRSRPASEWRWIFYGYTNTYPSDLLRSLDNNNLIDQGTGSTFNALVARGIIECRYKNENTLDLKLTRPGRKLAREALQVKPEKKLPPGTLRERHWSAMTNLYSARSEDKEITYDGAGNYGGMSWQYTLLRLRDYKSGPLIEEYKPEPYEIDKYAIRLSDYGLEFYVNEWTRYRTLYPDIAAPEPRPDIDTPSSIK